MSRPHLLSVVVLCVALAACARHTERSPDPQPSAGKYLAKEYPELERRIAACTRRHGYDPERVRGVAAYQLAPGELAWRKCAYNALREIVLPAARRPELYVALIELDKVLTKQIRQRKITRRDRTRRLEAQLNRIRRHELAEMQKDSPGMSPSERAKRERILRRTMNMINRSIRANRPRL